MPGYIHLLRHGGKAVDRVEGTDGEASSTESSGRQTRDGKKQVLDLAAT